MSSKPQRPPEHGWSTDAKISAGVLGALASLCVAVVGWRFVDSHYLGATPVTTKSTSPADSPVTSRHSQAIYAVPQLDPGGSAPQTLDGTRDAPRLPPTLNATGGIPSSTREPSTDSLPRVEEPPIAPNSAYESNGLASAAPPAAATYPPQSASSRPPREIAIQSGDSFWLISERAYGTGAYFKALYRFHEASMPEPDRLPVGHVLEIPTPETLRELFPEDVPADVSATAADRLRSYRTARGDTAISVARSQLGDASKWTEVFRLNQRAVTSPDAPLPEGYELKLPAAKLMAEGSSDPRRR